MNSDRYPTVALGGLVEISSGKRNSSEAVSDGIYSFYTCGKDVLNIDVFEHDREAVLLGGNNANAIFPVFYAKGKFTARQRVYVIWSANTEVLDNRFFYFALSHLTHSFTAKARGTTTLFVTLPMLKDLAIPLPPISTQRLVADFLAALENRISLLRETNATLEAIAQALFKSWFVDFDPVRAKQEGRAPEGVDEATAALFPDGLDESELGPVPRGWKQRSPYDLATYINGAAYKAFSPNAVRRGLPIIKIAELKGGVTSQTAFTDLSMPDKYRIRAGDILFSWSGNPDTSIDTFVWGRQDAWLNQHIFRVVPQHQKSRAFVLQTLRYLRPTFAELARNKQTTGLGHVTVADLKRLRVVCPDEAVLRQFDETVRPVHEKVFENNRTIANLEELRDTLLPRLTSGQLRLPEAEALVA